MGMFKGLAGAKVAQGRLPDPSEGIADYLVESLRLRLGETGDKRYEIRLVAVQPVTANGTPTGTRCQYCEFPARSVKAEAFAAAAMKRLLLTLADVKPEEEEEVVEMMCPKASPEFKDMVEDDRVEEAWDKILMQAFCIGEDGKPSEGPGIFDGQVVLRLETVLQEERGDTVYTKNKETGLMEAVPKRIYTRHYPKCLVPVEEAAKGLSEQQIKQVFGSLEKYAELSAA